MAYTYDSFDSEHQGIIHDVQYDYYGKIIATAGSDGKINIFKQKESKWIKKCELPSLHKGSVWQISWAHPSFGKVIASCGYDTKIYIFKKMKISSNKSEWTKIYEYLDHKNSVNSLAFAPHEYGLILLCGSSDGYFSLHECRSKINYQLDDEWYSRKNEGNSLGINSVSWAPPFYPISLDDENSCVNLAPIRFVTGGCDNLVKFWSNEKSLQSVDDGRNNILGTKFTCETYEGHSDWVRDVAWLNHIGLPYDIVASCGEDNIVYIWTKKKDDKDWKKEELKNFNVPVWRVSWSHCGSLLAVSAGNNCVYLFKENIESKWELVSKTDEEGKMEPTNSLCEQN